MRDERKIKGPDTGGPILSVAGRRWTTLGGGSGGRLHEHCAEHRRDHSTAGYDTPDVQAETIRRNALPLP